MYIVPDTSSKVFKNLGKSLNNAPPTADHFLLSKLLETATVFVYIQNVRIGQWVYASPNMQRLFNNTYEELMQKGPEVLTNSIIPADLEKAQEAEAAFLTAISEAGDRCKGIKTIARYRMKTGTGRIICLHEQKTVVETGADNEPLLIMAVLSDVTCPGKKQEFFSALGRYDDEMGWVISNEMGPVYTGNVLSEREKQVLRLVAKGKSSKVIAGELSISINTVNNHRKNMLLKTGTNNIAELIGFCLSNDII